MSKFLFLLLATLMCGSAYAASTDPVEAGPADAIDLNHWDTIIRDATETVALAPSALVAGATAAVPAHPLLPDASAMGSGQRADWPASGGNWSRSNETVRVFKWSGLDFSSGHITSVHKGYYVIGKQRSSSGDPFYQYRIWITRYNTKLERDTSFGTNGWMFDSSNNRAVTDAQIVGSKAYVLADIQLGDLPVTVIRCMELDTATGGNCFGLFAGIQSWTAKAAGPRTAAYGQRLAYDSRYGLFVAARVINSTRGEEVGIARVNADTGILEAGFRNDGYNIGLPSWAGEPGAKIAVNALAITPDNVPGTNRLYVAGQISRSTTDHDGFILGMSPVSGATSPYFDWSVRSYYHETDNNNFKKDAITALTILRNGKIAFAGWSQTDDPAKQPMFMGRLWHTNGNWDSAFCDGHPNGFSYTSTVCAVERGPGTKQSFTPVAIAERDGHGDLVVASRYQNLGTGVTQAVRTMIRQYSASGNTRHAELVTDYPGDVGQGHWSRPFDMWVGNTGTFNNGEELVAVLGSRYWKANEYHATTTLLRDTDSIFADQFGGSNND